jgi:hypothetical protein
MLGVVDAGFLSESEQLHNWLLVNTDLRMGVHDLFYFDLDGDKLLYSRSLAGLYEYMIM